MQRHRCSVLCVLSIKGAGKCSVRSSSVTVCISTHPHGLVHCSAVFSRYNLVMNSPHCHSLRDVATRHMLAHSIWQQSSSASWDTQYRAAEGKTSYPNHADAFESICQYCHNTVSAGSGTNRLI